MVVLMRDLAFDRAFDEQVLVGREITALEGQRESEDGRPFGWPRLGFDTAERDGRRCFARLFWNMRRLPAVRCFLRTSPCVREPSRDGRRAWRPASLGDSGAGYSGGRRSSVSSAGGSVAGVLARVAALHCQPNPSSRAKKPSACASQ